MNYQRAFREAFLLFPSSLSISTPSGEVGAHAKSVELAQAWEKAEQLTTTWSEWHQLAVWAIGCALHRCVREEGAKGVHSVSKTLLDRRYAEYKFAESLLTPNKWFPRHIKRAYRRDRLSRGLPPFQSNFHV
jgi:hypothetical protein